LTRGDRIALADPPGALVGGFARPGEGDAAVDLRGLKERADIIVGVAVVVASILVAIGRHRTPVYCSYLGFPGQRPPPCARPHDYPWIIRLGIVAAGLSSLD
jgi:hypothetical protein